jgi:hypothetical protein
VNLGKEQKEKEKMGKWGLILSELADEYRFRRISEFRPSSEGQQKKIEKEILKKCPWFLRWTLRRDIRGIEWLEETVGTWDFLSQFPPANETFEQIRLRLASKGK